MDFDSSALHGWHPGVSVMQGKVGYTSYQDRMSYLATIDYMPAQHRQFYAKNLSFLPLALLDSRSRPWCSFIFPDEQKAFVNSPTERQLDFNARTSKGDPSEWCLLKEKDRKLIKIPDEYSGIEENEELLTAGLGIELSTRRRNKFAGKFERVNAWRDGDQIKLDGRVRVNQVLGNCPKYIPLRSLTPHNFHPKISASSNNTLTTLSPEAVDVIHRSSLIFLATSFTSPSAISSQYPPHMGLNERAGRSGFVRFSSTKQAVYIPDYSGNRMMTSLGNIEIDGRCGISFPDFVTGQVLHLTATAKILVGEDAKKVMPRFKRGILIEATIEDWIFIEDALPMRDFEKKKEGEDVSPYSPPICYLAEEERGSVYRDSDSSEVLLEKIQLFLPDSLTLSREQKISDANLGVFRFKLLDKNASDTITWTPGQYAILDWTTFIGTTQYRHMAPGDEKSINDDSIRSWTISSIPTSDKSFELTMRLIPGGRVTSKLFEIAKALYLNRPDLVKDLTPLEMKVGLVGIAGDFTLQNHDQEKLLWISGGVGFTPFLSFLKNALKNQRNLDVVWALQSREPDIQVQIIRQILTDTPLNPGIHLDLTFFHKPHLNSISIKELSDLGIVVKDRAEGISEEYFDEIDDLTNRNAFVCGPVAMENSVVSMLERKGLDASKIKRESFNF